MIFLNLIPDEAKRLQKEIYRFSLWSSYTIALFIIITIFSIALFAGSLILENVFTTTSSESPETDLLSTRLGTDVLSANARLSSMADVQEGYIPWSQLLVSLSNHSSQGITLKTLSATFSDTSILTISGTAKTRESFITFKENLENDPLYTAVESPVKNLLEQENISFTLKATLDLENL